MLKSGLSSKLFLLSYLHPDSGYRYAQIIQNTDGVPNTSKIYPILKELENAGYLKKKHDKYYPDTSKLFTDIESFLKERKFNFSESELKHIKNIVFNHGLFLLFSTEIFDLISKQETRIHKINTLEFICDKIGKISTLYLHNKSIFSQFLKYAPIRTEYSKPITVIDAELEQNMLGINEKMKKSFGGSKSINNKKIKSVDLLNQTMKSFILFSIIFTEIPDMTLEKLSNLWSQKQAFEIGVSMSRIDPQLTLDYLTGKYDGHLDNKMS